LKLNGTTPLHWSALSGQVDCVRLLLEYQPIVDVKDSDGDTALNAACCKGHMQIIEILLEAGADPSIGDQSSINSLHMCADHGCLRGCELILARKPSLLNSFTCNGYSPLHLACDNGHFKVAEFLVQQ
jgi:cytohesin